MLVPALLLAAVLAAPGAPIGDDLSAYLLDSSTEVALARSAAPAHISDNATIWVLGPSGFEVAAEGSNGFHCLVHRSFSGPAANLDPRVRGPICLNPIAAESELGRIRLVARELAAGQDLASVLAGIPARVETGELSLPRAGALGYMMSSGQWLTERMAAWRPHLMFYAPNVTNDEMGGNGPTTGSPWVGGVDTGLYGNVTVPIDSWVTPQYLDRAALDDPTRTDADREQDPWRKGLEVYEWIGIRPGMRVADMIPGRGYNTHLLARALTPEGHVDAVYTVIADPIKERVGLDMRVEVPARIEAGGFTNITIHERTADLVSESLDAAVMIRNFHDITFFGGEQQPLLAELLRALKPGGLVGIVDVATTVDGWDEAGHALNKDAVIEAFTTAGFEFLGSSDMLANPEDDHTGPGFDIGRHTVDRYLLKFGKPGM